MAGLLLLLMPAAPSLPAFFLAPAAIRFSYSVPTQRPDGVVALPVKPLRLRHFLAGNLCLHVLLSTLGMPATGTELLGAPDKSLHRLDVTTAMVTHAQDEALTLRQGRLEQVDLAAEVDNRCLVS
jgi:hypothetical protein